MQNRLLIFLITLLTIITVFPQNWPTIGGSNQRNGLSKIIGPDSIITPLWSVSSSQTVIGNSIFSLAINLLRRELYSVHTLLN